MNKNQILVPLSNNSYDVNIRCVDSGNSSSYAELTYTVTIADKEEVPTWLFSSADPYSISINENITGDILTITAQDEDVSGSLSISFNGGSDDGKFTLSNSTMTQTNSSTPYQYSASLSLASALDYENPTDSGTDNAYTVKLIVKDENDYPITKEITVNVMDAEENPYFDMSVFNYNYTENTDLNTEIVQMTARDYDGDNIAFQVGGDDGSLFTLESQSSSSGVAVSKLKFLIYSSFVMP
mgnify:CR=1 FL=1